MMPTQRNCVLHALVFTAAVAVSAVAQSPQSTPLYVYWSYPRHNNAVVATTASIEYILKDPTYAFVDVNFYIASNTTAPDNSSIPLLFFVNPQTNHTITTASEQGKAWAAAHGFQQLRVEGWVYPVSNDSSNPSLNFEMWYSQERDDLFLVGTTENRNNAIGAGYTLQWLDCSVPYAWVVWPDAPPADIPFPKSTDLLDWEYSYGQNAVPPGINADTWYPSWASDGLMYSSFTDGTVNNVSSGSWTNPKHNATTGFVAVVGDDPFNLTIVNASIYMEPAAPYEGRYPCLNVVYNGVWYYGTYSLENYQPGVNPPPDCGNWCVQGPFTEIRYSMDYGVTWTAPRRFMQNDTDNLFGENAMNNQKVKFGAPHAVDFGQNMQYSPDGKMYIVGHGAVNASSHQSWMQGDQIYMARVVLSPETVNDRTQWEFFAGNPGPNALWSSNFSDAAPLFTWNTRTGVVTITYMPALKKYFMCVGTPNVSPSMVGPFDTYMLESDYITGPWSYISYLSQFGPEAYFVHFPSRFQSAAPASATPAQWTAQTGESVGDYRSAGISAVATQRSASGANATYYQGFLSYSANFASGGNNPNPPGSGYHWSLQLYRMQLSPAFAARLASSDSDA